MVQEDSKNCSLRYHILEEVSKAMARKQKIGGDDFLRMFDCHRDELPEQFLSGLKRVDTEYHEANLVEFEEYILNVLQRINSPEIVRTKEENLEAFEKVGERTWNLLFQAKYQWKA